ncbi:MAG TPA: DinB family protein [Puia sp.]|nr:DinB family protein [Puia sp.]
MVTKKDCIAAEFYSAYIALVKEDNLSKALKKNTAQVKKLLKKIRTKKVDYAYAEKKWTIKEILQHLIDAERVFAYRAITFARKDTTPLPSFDEKNWAENAKVKKRKWKDLVDEFKTVRKATEKLFRSFDDEQLLSKGTASDNTINVVALGFICAGHAAHHVKVIKQRYL